MPESLRRRAWALPSSTADSCMRAVRADNSCRCNACSRPCGPRTRGSRAGAQASTRGAPVQRGLLRLLLALRQHAELAAHHGGEQPHPVEVGVVADEREAFTPSIMPSSRWATVFGLAGRSRRSGPRGGCRRRRTCATPPPPDGPPRRGRRRAGPGSTTPARPSRRPSAPAARASEQGGELYGGRRMREDHPLHPASSTPTFRPNTSARNASRSGGAAAPSSASCRAARRHRCRRDGVQAVVERDAHRRLDELVDRDLASACASMVPPGYRRHRCGRSRSRGLAHVGRTRTTSSMPDAGSCRAVAASRAVYGGSPDLDRRVPACPVRRPGPGAPRSISGSESPDALGQRVVPPCAGRRTGTASTLVAASAASAFRPTATTRRMPYAASSSRATGVPSRTSAGRGVRFDAGVAAAERMVRHDRPRHRQRTSRGRGAPTRRSRRTPPQAAPPPRAPRSRCRPVPGDEARPLGQLRQAHAGMPVTVAPRWPGSSAISAVLGVVDELEEPAEVREAQAPAGALPRESPPHPRYRHGGQQLEATGRGRASATRGGPVRGRSPPAPSTARPTGVPARAVALRAAAGPRRAGRRGSGRPPRSDGACRDR